MARLYLICTIIGLWGCAAVVKAQESFDRDTLVRNRTVCPTEVLSPILPKTAVPHGVRGVNSSSDLPSDTLQTGALLTFPPLYNGRETIAYFPDFYSGYGLWDLHEGFNASLNMSVFASFGKNRFPGVGFGTGVSAMYAHALTDRLTLAVGGSYDRISWNGFNENRFGINLLAGFQLTDRISLYAYGSKVFIPKQGNGFRLPPMIWMNNYTERFGAMVHFKVSDAVSVSVSVEEDRWKQR